MIAESSVGDMASAIKHLKVAASAGSQDAFESFDECIPSQSNSQRRAGISLAFSGSSPACISGTKSDARDEYRRARMQWEGSSNR